MVGAEQIRQLRKFTGQYLQQLGWLLLPGTCLLCGLPSAQSRDICRSCERSLPWNDSACRRCALPCEPRDEGDGLCLQCANAAPEQPTLQQITIAAFHYRNPIDNLLHRLKFRSGFLENRVLASLLAEHISQRYTRPDFNGLPEVILPIPLAWRRLVRRGYNQSGILASRLSRLLDIPVDYRVLERKKQTRAQSSLARGQRKKNLEHAFHLARLPQGRRVALVDDVMTTGATLDSAAHVLQRAGIDDIHYWVVARTDLKHRL